MVPSFMWIVAGVIATFEFVMYVREQIQFWQKHAKRMQQSGYVVPPSTVLAKRTHRVVTRLIVFLAVGRIKVYGRVHLNVPGRKIFVPNHPFNLDFAVASVATKTCAPTLSKASELKHPLLAWLGAWTGAIPVDVTQPGGGAAAYNGCVEVLKRSDDAELLVFPQGKLLDRIEIDDFKPGAARMQQEVAKATGETVWLIPMHIDYLPKPAHPSLSQFLLAKPRSLFGKPRYGVVVSIGKPIPYDGWRSAQQTTFRVYNAIRRLA